MLEILDTVFHILHIIVIIINTTFWMSFKTLRIAQATLFLTVISWVGFGFFYGFGYCFLTDWQWYIKERLGESNLPSSYVKLVLDRTSGNNWNAEIVDQGTILVLLISIVGCLIQTIREKKRKEYL